MSHDSAAPWTAPLSMGFPRQEYWSGLPFPSPGHLPDPGIKPAFPALAGKFFTNEPPGVTLIKKKKKNAMLDRGVLWGTLVPGWTGVFLDGQGYSNKTAVGGRGGKTRGQLMGG